MPVRDPARRKKLRRRRYLARREIELAAMAVWRKANPERHRSAARRSHLKLRYGVTAEQYEAMLAAQGGCCAICGRQPKGKRRLEVDHDHRTGKTRALLCGDCNRSLGLMHDDVSRFEKAAEYLKRHATGSPLE